MNPVPTTLARFLYAFLSVCLVSCGGTAELLVGAAPPEQVYTRTLELPGYDRPVSVRYSLEHGLAIMEGDIILGSEAQLSTLGPQANLVRDRAYRWPGGVIPYRLDASVSAEGRANFTEAVKRWEHRTAFRFVSWTGQKDFVTFTRGNAEHACFSAVGRRGGEQFVYLTASGSCSLRTLVHELGHTVGLWHEQSRNDRDAWLKINYDNIVDGQAYNFDKTGAVGKAEGRYDYCSVMHYGAYAFSKDALPTLEFLKPPHCARAVGQAENLSRGDVAAANRLIGPRQLERRSPNTSALSQSLALYAAYCLRLIKLGRD